MILDRMNEVFESYRFEMVVEENIDDVFQILRNNKYYSETTRNKETTRQECIEEITAIPSGIDFENKTYVIVYSKNIAIGIIDFVEGYPREDIGYLGLLIIDEKLHGHGIGREILMGVFAIASEIGLTQVELACFENNKRGLNFWLSMGFVEYRKTLHKEGEEERQLISLKYNLK